MLASLAWEEVSQTQSWSHQRRRRPSPPPPPPLGPPSRSSTEDYNQTTSTHRRRCPPRKSGGQASRPRWMMGCLHWKPDGSFRHFLYRLEEKGMMDEEEGWFRGHRASSICRAMGTALRLQAAEIMVI